MEILITGAARGLGLELTRKFLQEGHRVFAGVRSLDHAALLSELSLQHGEALQVCALDVTDEDSVQSCRRMVQRRTGTLDVVFNNAAILEGLNDGIRDVNLEDVQRTFEVNTFGAVRVVKHFADLLRNAPSPMVVNVSSEAGSMTTSGSRNYSYCMSKSAMNMFTSILRNEFRDEMKVYAVHPGRMRTDMGRTDFPLHPSETAHALYALATQSIDVDLDRWFINIHGEAMPW